MDQPLNAYLEHTYLRPDTTLKKVKEVISEAQENEFVAVCVPPLYMRDARRLLGEQSKIKLATVVGFPTGYAAISSKVEEIKRAVDEGADEIDAVLNVAAYRSGQKNAVLNDIQSIIRATHLKGCSVKTIIETAILEEKEIVELARICIEEGAQFIKTGTGFYGPTKVEVITLLKKHLGNQVRIKAAGGIRTAAEALAMIRAGAERIGTSSALEIIKK